MREITLADAAYLLSCPGQFSSALIQGYTTDSRLLKAGDLFFALKGDRVDGHDYLHEVRERGAIAAIVSKHYRGSIEGLCLLTVESPLQALQELARILLFRSSSRIVGVTGSIGKTSTKEFIKVLLARKYRVAASPGNHNSQVGMPLALLNHTMGNEEIVILEMGMTAAGQLSRLIEIAPPEVALITTVALVHACNFESLEEIARAKGEILSHSHTRLGIVHRDIPNYSEICSIGHCQKRSFSTTSQQVDYGINLLNTHQIQIEDHVEKQSIVVDKFPLPGKHNIHNFLGAIAVARYFEIEWEEIKLAIPSLMLPQNRLQFIRHQEVLFLNDSYNAAEPSVKAALQILPQPENQGRKIAVLGGMMELGKFSHDCHSRVGEFALGHVDYLYCLGEECLPMVDVWIREGRRVKLFHQRHDLVACLKEDLRPHDVVLLKGSRSKELWKVLEEFSLY